MKKNAILKEVDQFDIFALEPCSNLNVVNSSDVKCGFYDVLSDSNYKVIEITVNGSIYVFCAPDIDKALALIYGNPNSMYLLYRKITNRSYKHLKTFGYV